MTSTAPIRVSNVTALAREEFELPPGSIPEKKRPIGFASIFITIENDLDIDTTIRINNVQIINADTKVLIMQQSHSQDIALEPLEYAETVLKLTNQTGYPGIEQVQAVVNLIVQGQQQILTSPPVTIDRPID